MLSLQLWKLCVGTQSLTLPLSLYSVSRDDLFRVELDNVVGDEMFYSKVSTTLDGQHLRFCGGGTVWK